MWETVYIISTILILPVFIWAIVVSIRVHSVFNKYSEVSVSNGITAKQLVEQIALENGLQIEIEETGGSLGDHYDPKRKVVALSGEVINSTSITALSVAAHECGHALQDKESYAPLKIRQFVIHLSNFASKLLVPLIFLSLIASIFIYTAGGYEFMMWVLVGLCAIYGLSALVNLITLPTEFDASRRAKRMLEEMHIIRDEAEFRGVKKVLNAAAQTYAAALAVSLVYFLRMLSYLMIFVRRD
jgi:Zn-dependent membrane protease YugP